jgi:hypothetical protein
MRKRYMVTCSVTVIGKVNEIATRTMVDNQCAMFGDADVCLF